MMPELIRDSKVYRAITYDITMKDIVGEERYSKMQGTKAYRFLSDWLGLAVNKVALGMFMDSQAGMLVGTSLIARGISLGVHSMTSPFYTMLRDFVYKNGNITPDRPKLWRYGAELLAFNGFQTPLYVAQIATAIGIRAAVDSSVDFDEESLDTVGRGALAFFKNSWWLAFAGKWTMDGFRRFFGSKTPEQRAELETLVGSKCQS